MNQSIIEHKANMYYVELREDYLHISQNCTFKKDGKSKASPYCKAFILAILEHWTNDKRGKGEGLYIFMSYSQWIKGMYGMFGRTVIIDSIEELMGEGLIYREAYKMFGRDTFKYLLNTAEINRRMRALPERNPEETHPNLDQSTSKHDPSTSKRVTSSQVNGSHLLVDTYPSTSNHNIESNIETNIDSDRESVNAATLEHEGTHTSFSQSSELIGDTNDGTILSAQRDHSSVGDHHRDHHRNSQKDGQSLEVAETTAPTPQARSRAEAATSAPAPRTPDFPPVLPQGVRGVFPQDTNVVGSPPADNKAQVNPPKKARWELLLDYWDSKYGPSPRPKWVEKEAQDMIKRMEPTPEKIDKVCAELKAHQEPITFENMYNHWDLLKEVEKREQAKTNAVPKSISGRKRVQETDPAYAEYRAMMTEGGK